MAAENRHTHPNYSSGEDYILEFRSFRYGFNSIDFAQRVEMAAVELGLVQPGLLRHDECADHRRHYRGTRCHCERRRSIECRRRSNLRPRARRD